MEYIKKTLVIKGDKNEKAIVQLEKISSKSRLDVKLYNLDRAKMNLVFENGLKNNFERVENGFSKFIEYDGSPFMCELVKTSGQVLVGKTADYVEKRNEKFAFEYVSDSEKHKIIDAEESESNDVEDVEDEEKIESSEIAEEPIEKKEQSEEEEKQAFPSVDGFEGEVATVNYYKNEIEDEEIAADAGKILSEFDDNRELSFYEQIKEELDELFEKFPADEYLMQIIPSSKWAKVSYNAVGGSYSVGILTDGEDVLFIGYGILSEFGKEPPKELGMNAQWVPLDFANPKDNGYFMMYQSAKDGKNV